MKTTSLLAAAAAVSLLAGTAFAQEATPDATYQFTSQQTVQTESRAAVKAEAVQAVRSGVLHETRQIDPVIAAPSGRSRAEVRAEAYRALRNGEIERANLEAYAFNGRIDGSADNVHLAQAAR